MNVVLTELSFNQNPLMTIDSLDRILRYLSLSSCSVHVSEEKDIIIIMIIIFKNHLIFKVKYHSLSILNGETPLIDLIKNYLTGNFYFLRSLPLSIFKSLSDCSGESTVLFS